MWLCAVELLALVGGICRWRRVTVAVSVGTVIGFYATVHTSRMTVIERGFGLFVRWFLSEPVGMGDWVSIWCIVPSRTMH